MGSQSSVFDSCFIKFTLRFWPRSLYSNLIYMWNITPFSSNKNDGLRKNYWITYCTHVTSHAIWVDEIAVVKRLGFFKYILHNVSNLPLCVYISIKNIGRSIPLSNTETELKQSVACKKKSVYANKNKFLIVLEMKNKTFWTFVWDMENSFPSKKWPKHE